MPVFVDDINNAAQTISLALLSEDVALRTEKFLATTMATIDPPLTSESCFLCLQGESSILCLKRSDDKSPVENGRFFVGSIEATTCVIALCWVKSSDSSGEISSAALGTHIACISDAKEFSNHIQRLANLIPGAGNSREQVIEISLFGAFDPSGHESSRGVVESIIESVSLFHVKLMVSCVWNKNTKLDSNRGVAIPRITAAAIDVRSGSLKGSSETRELFHGTIPLELERRARSTWSDNILTLLPTCFCGDDSIESSLFTSVCSQIRPSIDVNTLKWLLSMPDSDLLHKISTSPEAEDSSFLRTQRLVMQFLVERAETN